MIPLEGEQKNISHPEGVIQTISNTEIKNKNLETLLEPTIPDLNELSRRKSNRTPKPTNKVV